jgi:hypothetical protein
LTLIPPDLREAVVRRAGNRCEYCRLSQESQVATFPVDHVIPVVAEGKTAPENLALSCPRCNANKWTRVEAVDPVSGQLVPLFNPRTEVWLEHFRWSETDPTLVEALSPTGRATVSLLDLNSVHHLTVRRWLMAVGMHPPG